MKLFALEKQEKLAIKKFFIFQEMEFSYFSRVFKNKFIHSS